MVCAFTFLLSIHSMFPEYGMLRRLHNLLPTPAGTAYFTASSETPAPESAVPLRKVRSPRSASLPSIRWDKSPLSRRTTREGSLLTKVMTSEGAEPSNAPQTNVKGLKIRMITWNMHDSLPKVRIVRSKLKHS